MAMIPMDRTTRTRLIYGALVLLVVGVYAMNAVMQQVWDAEKAEREALLEARRREELGIEPATLPEGPPSAFEIPPNHGPADAPVRIVVYVDSSNGCLEGVVETVSSASEVYGDLVHVDYRDTLKPELRTEAEEKQIGCEAGLLFNDEITRRAQPGEIAGLKTFIGPPDEGHYSSSDIYGAINYILKDAGIDPPAAALAAATPELH